MRLRYIIYVLVALLLMAPMNVAAKKKTNDQQAEEIFRKVYGMVFGPQGCQLSYAVNIIGMYKTEGTIYYKGKKVHYDEPRFSSWQDGVTAYMVDKKKKEVRIHRADDEKKDKYLSKFKCDLNGFIYSMKTDGDYYLVTAKLKNARYFGIRWVELKVRKGTLYPVSLGIKMAFMHTTVKITGFKTGGIADQVFVYPASRFTGYKVTDNR